MCCTQSAATRRSLDGQPIDQKTPFFQNLIQISQLTDFPHTANQTEISRETA